MVKACHTLKPLALIILTPLIAAFHPPAEKPQFPVWGHQPVRVNEATVQGTVRGAFHVSIAASPAYLTARFNGNRIVVDVAGETGIDTLDLATLTVFDPARGVYGVPTGRLMVELRYGPRTDLCDHVALIDDQARSRLNVLLTPEGDHEIWRLEFGPDCRIRELRPGDPGLVR